MKNRNIVLEMKKTYPLENAQECWDKTGNRLNYLLYAGTVYNTANLNAGEIAWLFQSLHELGTCTAVDSPKRVTPCLKEWLSDIGETDTLSTIQAQTTLKTRKNRCQLTEEEKKNKDFIGRLEDCLELRSPSQIVSSYLTNLKKQEEYAKETLAGIIEWYYSNYDLTPIHTLESMGLYETLDLSKYYQIGYCLTSKEVMKMVVDAYMKYYKRENNINLDKVASYLNAEGFGV